MTEISREEAHRIIDYQIQTLDDIDAKAARILRINILVIGVVLTVLSFATTAEGAGEAPFYFSELMNIYSIIGLILVLTSMGMAAITYTSSSLKAGVSANDLRKFLNNSKTDQQNLEGLVEGYADWIEYNYKVNAKNAPLGTLTLILLIYSMAFLALGVKRAATGHVEWWLLGGTIALAIFIILFTGFIDQIQRYRRIA